MFRFTAVLLLSSLLLLPSAISGVSRTAGKVALGKNIYSSKPILRVNAQRSTSDGQIAVCPPGFQYLKLAESCYKVIYESDDWGSAGQKCQKLSNGAHLAAIRSEAENSALKKFLATELSKNESNTICAPSGYGPIFWTSGQRLVENSCTTDSPFVWKPWSDKSLPFEYKSWVPGDPNCRNNSEHCVHIRPRYDFNWNDLPCNTRMCSLCEYNP